ncbi:HTH-type transcriptional regulator CueR [compost metagenome]
MRISELSKLTGASIRSLRYYEQKGLLTSDREENGYRIYHQLTIERVRTIQFYLNLGFNTDQIEGILNCVMKHPEEHCGDVLPLYEQKLAEIEEQLALLNRMKVNLQDRISFIRKGDK